MERKKVTAITRRVLLMMLAASKDNQANSGEFVCALRADDGVITEFLLIPGTISSESYAIFSTHHLPIDFSIVGIAHSHPRGSIRPSEADLKHFSQFGHIQIIMGFPYDLGSWKAYSRDGEEIHLDVI